MSLITYTFDFSNVLVALANAIDGTEDDAKFLLKSLLQHDIIHDSDYPDEFMSNPLVPDSKPVYGLPKSADHKFILKQFIPGGYSKDVYKAYTEVRAELDTILEDNRNSVISIVFEFDYTYIIIGPSIKEYRYDEAVNIREIEELIREDSL